MSIQTSDSQLFLSRLQIGSETQAWAAILDTLTTGDGSGLANVQAVSAANDFTSFFGAQGYLLSGTDNTFLQTNGDGSTLDIGGNTLPGLFDGSTGFVSLANSANATPSDFGTFFATQGYGTYQGSLDTSFMVSGNFDPTFLSLIGNTPNSATGFISNNGGDGTSICLFGTGTDSGNQSIAIGAGSNASGSGVAIGGGTPSASGGGVAIGYVADAFSGAVAIGSNLAGTSGSTIAIADASGMATLSITSASGLVVNGHPIIDSSGYFNGLFNIANGSLMMTDVSGAVIAVSASDIQSLFFTSDTSHFTLGDGTFAALTDIIASQKAVTNAAPTTGQTVNTAGIHQDELIYIQPAGTLLALTIQLEPGGGVVADIGDVKEIFISQIITGLTVSATGGTVRGTALTTSSAVNGSYEYIKVTSTDWLRIR